jgi:hypothetical protein
MITVWIRIESMPAFIRIHFPLDMRFLFLLTFVCIFLSCLFTFAISIYLPVVASTFLVE